ncbi:hypothetical protein ATANTOWER_010060, partial [Ataeniobius toweri]|nr:hypothetical protein [Ataeniobius toweri]
SLVFIVPRWFLAVFVLSSKLFSHVLYSGLVGACHTPVSVPGPIYQCRLQKTPSSPVSCNATGFHTNQAEMFWMKDGEEIHQGVEEGEILPNNDGTFQKKTDLNISLVTPKDWIRYSCAFQLSDMKNITTRLK